MIRIFGNEKEVQEERQSVRMRSKCYKIPLREEGGRVQYKLNGVEKQGDDVTLDSQALTKHETCVKHQKANNHAISASVYVVKHRHNGHMAHSTRECLRSASGAVKCMKKAKQDLRRRDCAYDQLWLISQVHHRLRSVMQLADGAGRMNTRHVVPFGARYHDDGAGEPVAVEQEVMSGGGGRQ